MSPNLIFLIFIFIWFLAQIRRLFFHISIFQLKEFRFDRYFSWLKTQEGLNVILHPWSLTKFVVLGALSWPTLFHFCFYGFFLIYFLEGIYTFFEIITLRFKRPKLTVKVTGLLILSFSIITAAALSIILLATNWLTNLSLFNNSLVKQLLIIDRLLILLIIIQIAFLNILNNKLRKHSFEKLAKVMKKNKKLKIIAITGSYGKTSTKNFLHALLCEWTTVLTIPKNINTEIGIANFILKELKAVHKILIVEIGAYRKGEIKNIGSILKPDISILTAISNQHLDLFGSQKNIIEAKFEIGEILKPNGSLIINQDSPFIKTYIKNFKKIRPDIKVKRVSITEKADYYATQISAPKPDGNITQKLTFLFNEKRGKSPVYLKTNLTSSNFVINLLLTIATARELGIKIPYIASKTEKISQPDHTLKIYKNKLLNNIIIDDSYSANETGFLEAINAADKLKAKTKVIIFRPLIELGPDSARAHQNIAEKMAKTFNYIITTSYDYIHIISSTLNKSGFNMRHFMVVKDERKLLSLIKNMVQKDTLILIENRVPEIIVQYLKSKSSQL